MDTIFVNLPRIAYEAKKNDEKFLSILRENINLSLEGFKAKKKFINERLKQPLLPVLSGGGGAVPYFYERNASYNLSFIGLTEAVEAHSDSGEQIHGAGDFATKLLQETSKFLKEFSREEEMRITISQRPGDEAVERLAELDIEQYGRSVMAHDAARGASYYTDIPTIPLTTEMPINARIGAESKIQPLLPGGHLNVICISDDAQPKALFRLTEGALTSGCKFLTYSSNYTTCSACGHTDKGIWPKCSKCASDRLSYLGRASTSLLPFSLWPDAKRRSVDRRVAYRLMDSGRA